MQALGNDYDLAMSEWIVRCPATNADGLICIRPVGHCGFGGGEWGPFDPGHRFRIGDYGEQV
jgi:hypothetical protein